MADSDTDAPVVGVMIMWECCEADRIIVFIVLERQNPPFFFTGFASVCVTLLGYLKGGDTFRLHHSHSDACLTLPPAEQGEEPQK